MIQIPEDPKLWMPSDSSLDRADQCPMSCFVQPRVNSSSQFADRGSVVHEHVEQCVTMGYNAAVKMLDQTIARWGLEPEHAEWVREWTARWTWRPPQGAVSEQALAFRGSVVEPYSRQVAEIATGARGTYNVEPGRWAYGTFDFAWSEPEPLVQDSLSPSGWSVPEGSMLWVGDLKTGQEDHVPPVERNPQIASLASKACKFFGVDRCVAAIVFLGPKEGTWDTVEWGPSDVGDAFERVRDIHYKVRSVAKGEAAQVFTVGDLCKWCPAWYGCPSHVTMLQTLTHNQDLVTQQSLRDLLGLKSSVEKLGKMVEGALRKAVRESGPVDLGNGLVYGPKPQQKSTYLPEALTTVYERLGMHAFKAASVSKKGIEEAAKSYLAEEGSEKIPRAKLVREIVESIDERGQRALTDTESWTVHRSGDKSNSNP